MSVKAQSYNINYFRKTATIANGAALSSAVSTSGGKLIGVKWDASMTSSSFEVQFSHDGTTWYDFYDNGGNQLTVSVVAGAVSYFLPQDAALGFEYVRLNDGSAEGGARDIEFIFRPL